MIPSSIHSPTYSRIHPSIYNQLPIWAELSRISYLFSQCHSELWLVELVPAGHIVQCQNSAVDLYIEESDNAAQEIDKHSKFIKGNSGDHTFVCVSDSPAIIVVSSTELALMIMCNPRTHHYLVLHNSSTDVLQPCVVILPVTYAKS